MANGTVGFSLWDDGVPPPSPLPVQGCRLEGMWQASKVKSPINITALPGGDKNSFLWTNPDPSPVPSSGWKQATGSVNQATGEITFDYHRIEKRGCAAAPASWLHCYNITSKGCDCVLHGAFVGDCDHASMPDSGLWQRQGVPTPAPTPPAPPSPSPPPTGTKLLTGQMVISQASEGASTIITTLHADAGATLGSDAGVLTIDWDTWAFGGAPGGKQNGAAYATRTLSGSHQPVTAIIVSKLLSDGSKRSHASTSASTNTAGALAGVKGVTGASLQFNISAGDTVTIVTTVLTSVTTNDAPPLPPALAANAAVANDQSGGAAAKVKADAARFWAQFWARSSVSLGPKWGEAERYWYASQYLIAMASRAGRIAPGLWGPWVTTDSPAWCGGYTLGE